MGLSREQAEHFAKRFNLQNLRKEGGEWVADDVYTAEKDDGIEGTDPYTITEHNYNQAIKEGDLDAAG